MNEGKPTKTKWWPRPRPTPDGDYALARPTPATDATVTREGEGTSDDAGDAAPSSAADPRLSGGAPAAEPVSGRPTPLHEPDPYSTPPYGEPGPWAPAPPVQHPTATPARGTATPPATPPAPPAFADTPPPGTQPDPAFATAPPPGAEPDPAYAATPPSAPVYGDAPPPGAQPDPTFATTPPPVAPSAPAFADAPPASPQPVPAYAAAPPSTPAHATAPPPGAEPAPAHAAAPPSAPAYATAPPPGAQPDMAYADVPPPAAEPAPAFATTPPPVAPSAPAFAGASSAPQPHAPAFATTPPLAAPSPVGPPHPVLQRRYDSWAASVAAPLQHSGVPAPRRRRVVRGLVGAGLVLALVSGGVGGAIGAYLERNGGVGTVELPQAAKEDGKRAPDSVAGIAARALPSVVTLHVSGSDAAGTGTGFVLDDTGHILTNNHVVEPAGDGGEITVTFNSGDTAEATVVGRDSGYDLAVVRVKGVHGLTPMPLGNSENVRVGDPVVAIGAPFDLAGTVTSGIISAKERPITAGGEESDGGDVSYVDALQTDAPINPGNSGGPLLDAQGRAIGINSAIRSGGGVSEPDGAQAGSIGLGFAIPINQGKRVAEELINTGKAVHPVIGITLDMNHTGDGARVADAGAAAGIKAGDVITAVDGQRVHSGEELIVKTRAHRPGDRLELTLERGGKETKVSLVLGSSAGD